MDCKGLLETALAGVLVVVVIASVILAITLLLTSIANVFRGNWIGFLLNFIGLAFITPIGLISLGKLMYIIE